MNQGKVKFYNKEKGFGFIINSDTNKEIFFHVTGLVDTDIQKDTLVNYDEAEGKKGVKAVNVTLA